MNRNLATVLLLTFITIVIWVAFQIFKTTTESTIPTPTQKQIEPLNPSLDKKVLEELKNLQGH